MVSLVHTKRHLVAIVFGNLGGGGGDSMIALAFMLWSREVRSTCI